MKRRIKFTVVLKYPEWSTDGGFESTIRHVTVARRGNLKDQACSAIEAAQKQVVRQSGCGEWGDPPGSELLAIAVFRGHMKDLTDGEGEIG